MIWAGTIGGKFLGPIREPEGVKITSAAFCQLLESDLLLWLDDVPLSKRCILMFQHDNTPSHSAKATQVFLSSFGIEGDRLI